MRCFVSPTTFNVDSVAAHRVGATLEAILMQRMLEPLLRACDLGTGIAGFELARMVAERDSSHFAALLAAQLSGSGRHD